MLKQRNLWMRLNNPELPLADTHIGVIGVPYDSSVTHERGSSKAPNVLREISSDKWPLTENFISLEKLKIKDFGDADVENKEDYAVQEAVTKKVKPIVEADIIPLVLGGDHSITSGVVKAFENFENLGILWFDSHYDVMDRYKGLKGRKISKYNHACPLRRILEMPNVKPENVLIIGVRDFIIDELNFIIENHIETVYAKDFLKIKPDTIVDIIKRKFENLPGVYVSFDIDILDPAYAPGTGVPIPGGISTRFLLDLLRRMFEQEKKLLYSDERHLMKIVGFDMVEISPPHDIGRITSFAGISIITAIFEYICLQEGITDIEL